MVDVGWNGSGVDISDVAINKAKTIVPEARLMAGTIDIARLTGPYDLIVMAHVLEHLPRPMECLRKCFDLLAPGGILLIAIPNLQSFEAALFRKYRTGLDTPRHLIHFRESVLVETLKSCRYEIVSTRPQMLASSVSESILQIFPQSVRRHLIGSPLARVLYLLLIMPACLSYLFGNRGAIEIRARRPA
jgi:2-polyprenyl-3-methyl-5-hydroxy-6-metoxy-1,4-benzoquinol methylase